MAYRTDGPYPSGMKTTADHIKDRGLTPGIWFMPFAGNFADPHFKDLQKLFVKNGAGQAVRHGVGRKPAST